MSDPSGWATTRFLPLRTCTMFVTGVRTWVKLYVLTESMMATLGSEELSCNGKIDGLSGGGDAKVPKLSTYYLQHLITWYYYLLTVV